MCWKKICRFYFNTVQTLIAQIDSITDLGPEPLRPFAPPNSFYLDNTTATDS